MVNCGGSIGGLDFGDEASCRNIILKNEKKEEKKRNGKRKI